MLDLLSHLGCGFDCASRAELDLVLDLVSTERIIYANPCKSRNYIDYSLRRGVQKMTFDSEEELRKICEIGEGAE
jgi:ornithine decarboxylase